MGRRGSGEEGRGKEREVGIGEREAEGRWKVVEKGRGESEQEEREKGRGIKLVTCRLHTVLPPLDVVMATRWHDCHTFE